MNSLLRSVLRAWFAVVVLPGLGGCDSRSPFPTELTTFRPLSEQPVFTGAPGQWDALIRERGWIVIDDGVWKLYYTGYSDPKGVRRLGLATSKDGLTWTRHPGNPLVADHWIEDMMIVQDDAGWYMVAEGEKDQAHAFTSKDGLTWTRVGPLDVRMKSGQPIEPGPYGTPTVLRVDDGWRLFYERGDKGVWLAASPDRTVWTHVQDDPVLVPGPAEYDADLIALNQVFQRDGQFFAVYHGCKDDPDKTKRRWITGLAVSKDLIRWTKYPRNPIVPRDDNRSSGQIVFLPDGGIRLYTMHPAVWAYERNR